MNQFDEHNHEFVNHDNSTPNYPSEQPQQTTTAWTSPQQPPNVNQYGYGNGYPNSYPPQQPQGYNQYHGYQPQQYPQQQAPYQYSPTSGWQAPVQPEVKQDPYKWNFDEYDNAAKQGEKSRKKHKGFVVFAVSMACVLALTLIAGSAVGIQKYVTGDDSIINSITATEPIDGDAEAEKSEVSNAKLEIISKPSISESLPLGDKLTIPQVCKSVMPSVVGVLQYQPEQSFTETGAGSGIIITADGYIVTNAHVVEGGSAFKVVLSDGTPKDAELIGYDSLTDLAVLKVADVTDLKPAVFGDSTQVEVGEGVIAIGNPAGQELAGSVTRGIVSAVNRQIPNKPIPLIQTDAAINPGNSGGALVNEYGQVIGINSSKIVAESYESIAFAIPVSEAKPIVDDIITNGRVTGRVKLGITGRTIDEIDARKYQLAEGVRIENIDPTSDLVNANVQRYDIITHIDGQRVLNMNELKAELNKHKPGETITLSLFRPVGTTKSETLDVTVTLMEDK